MGKDTNSGTSNSHFSDPYQFSIILCFKIQYHEVYGLVSVFSFSFLQVMKSVRTS